MDKRQVFILKANKIHGDKYDYSKVEYIDSHTKIRIICNNHGEFFQTPSNHLNKKGCRDCSYELRAKQKSMSKEEFIRKSNKKHNNIYKYEKFVSFKFITTQERKQMNKFAVCKKISYICKN